MEDTRGRWTAELIGELSPRFYRRHVEVAYYLTQMLTGHGLFHSYLHKMGKVWDPHCSYCGDPKDDALHTFLRCGKWLCLGCLAKEKAGHTRQGQLIE